MAFANKLGLLVSKIDPDTSKDNKNYRQMEKLFVIMQEIYKKSPATLWL